MNPDCSLAVWVEIGGPSNGTRSVLLCGAEKGGKSAFCLEDLGRVGRIPCKCLHCLLNHSLDGSL